VDCLGEMSEDVSNGSWGDTATLTPPPPPLQGCHTSRYQIATGPALPVEEGASDGSEMISVLCSEHRASGRLSPACSDSSSGFECSDSDSFSATSSLTYHHDEKNCELLTNCLNQKMKSSSRRRRLVPAESKSQGFPVELLVESSRKKKRWRQMKKCRFQPIDCSRTITSGGSWIQQQRNQQQRDPSNEEVFSSILDPLLPCLAKLSRMITAKSNPNYSMSAIFWWLICLCLLPSSGNCLQCYTDVAGTTMTTCDEVQGFKTCFTKYNDSKSIPSVFPFGVLHKYQERAHIVGRGCSTKDKVFYRECETHSYGANLEKMCFCSFELCNQGAPGASPPLPLPPISSMVKLNSLVSASGFLCALLVSPGHSLTRLWHHLAEGWRLGCLGHPLLLITCCLLVPKVFSRRVIHQVVLHPTTTATQPPSIASTNNSTPVTTDYYHQVLANKSVTRTSSHSRCRHRQQQPKPPHNKSFQNKIKLLVKDKRHNSIVRKNQTESTTLEQNSSLPVRLEKHPLLKNS